MIKNRFYVLDLLRLVAAFGVVFYHYSIYLDKGTDLALINFSSLGYLGVNFFFMLSGFVIMASAESRPAFTFLVARAQRLYPAFIACLSITLLAIWLGVGRSVPLKQALLNFTILNDYLKVPNIDGVYWTLQAEIKFYGCIFILSLFGLLPHWRYWLPIWCACAILFHFTHQPFFMGWFINPEYSFYFIGGVSAYLLYKYPLYRFTQIIFAISALFAIVNAQSQIENFVNHPEKKFVVFAQVIVFAFYLFFYLLARGWMNIKSVPKWWVYLGAISYPLYLLHNRAGKTLIDQWTGQLNIYLLLAITIAAVVLASFLVHYLIEKPINNLLAKRKK